jgi:hypothetical protein
MYQCDDGATETMKSYDHGYQLFCDNLVNFVDLKKSIECDYSQFIENICI